MWEGQFKAGKLTFSYINLTHTQTENNLTVSYLGWQQLSERF